MGNFQELRVWQKSKELAVFIYRATNEGAFAKDWGLRDQIRGAGVSIPSNIAEGDELSTDRHAVKFFYTAKGSAAELLTQAIIAHEIEHLTDEQFNQLETECRKISGMLTKLIRARSGDIGKNG